MRISTTFTATVAGTAYSSLPSGPMDGTVTFYDGGTSLGVGTITDDGLSDDKGTATSVATTLSAGPHVISAVYNGDGSNYLSTSWGSSGELITQDVTTTSLVATLPPTTATFGTVVSYTARVNNTSVTTYVPTGAVTFVDGTVSMGTGALTGNPAKASLAVSSLPVGVDTIVALYQGDGSASSNLANSVSATRLITITQATTTTAVTAAPTSLPVGQTATFTATLTASAVSWATGTVTFLDNGVSMGTGAVSGGQATYATSSLPAGTDTITAIYSGDTNFVGSTAPGITETVQQGLQTTPPITWAAPAAITYGTALSATQLNATGSVAGTMTYSPVAGTVLSAGASQALQVTFTPTDTTDYTTATDTVYMNVNKASTTMAVSPSTNPSVFGQSVTFTATVSAASAAPACRPAR